MFPGFTDLDAAPSALGDMLAERRRAKGMSQTQLADKMGTSQPAVARLEAGATNARLSTLLRYAQALDLELSIDLSNPPDAPQRDSGS